MVELAIGVELSSQHWAEGRPIRIAPVVSGESHRMPLVQIHSGTKRPADAFAAARYGRSWFGIDDRDLNSKRLFMFLRMFSALAETGEIPQAATVIIPAH